MDETQEDDVEERIVSQEKVVSNDENDEKTENVEEAATSNDIKNEDTENIFGSATDSIRFDNQVERYDPVNEEKKSEPINFESKPEPDSLYDDEEEENNESITIGESINMKFDEENEAQTNENDIVPIDLNILPIEDSPPPEPKKDVIDLGIEEIKL